MIILLNSVAYIIVLLLESPVKLYDYVTAIDYKSSGAGIMVVLILWS